jgi:RimJ/RimL family protein N-acetyltransferase
MRMDRNRLAGENVRLTGLRASDVSAILAWREDTRFLRLWNSDPLVGRSEAKILEWIDEANRPTTGMAFAIRLHQEEDLIGIVGLDEIEWPNRVASLGIGIGDPDHWGKRYGTDATRLMIDYAFNELNLHRLQLTVFEFNARAIALYEKMGFRKEGTFRQFMERDNKRYDMLLYGLLRSEWKVTPQ